MDMQAIPMPQAAITVTPMRFSMARDPFSAARCPLLMEEIGMNVPSRLASVGMSDFWSLNTRKSQLGLIQWQTCWIRKDRVDARALPAIT
jgi:hypothetical protein